MHVHVLCGCMEVTVRSHQFKQGWDGMGWDRREDSLQRPYSSADEGACVTILALPSILPPRSGRLLHAAAVHKNTRWPRLHSIAPNCASQTSETP